MQLSWVGAHVGAHVGGLTPVWVPPCWQLYFNEYKAFQTDVNHGMRKPVLPPPFDSGYRPPVSK
jgi:hypothetical protein